MLNDLAGFICEHKLLSPGDHVVCCVSGGADSMALLWGMLLLREKLNITVSAAHFNHNLRGEESHRDEAFVRGFCHRNGIQLTCGGGKVISGEKGLEAAARDARYAFFETLEGKLATAHTADDNAETVLMHLVRGTGLRGLGGIAPVRGRLIRPMLGITREQVLSFLEENRIDYVEDSSNSTDAFLRNRLRHGVMPLLKKENPKLAESVSAMALRLREDEAYLCREAERTGNSVSALRDMPVPVRRRALEKILLENGVREPEARHIEAVEQLLDSDRPSARLDLPGDVTISRVYDRLERIDPQQSWEERTLSCGDTVEIPAWNVRIVCEKARGSATGKNCISFLPQGTVRLRNRQPGDLISLPGGRKSLKKAMIDRKIPAYRRDHLPVVADDGGVIAAFCVGVSRDRHVNTPDGWEIRMEPMNKEKK